MRMSTYIIPTLKESPAEASIISHQLMLRAGLMRQLSSGLYVWLPLGLKVLKKVETIVREEMNKSGALEVMMPAVQPAEIWKESGRWDEYGAELLRFQDRHGRDFVFGPTHEEVITHILKHEIASYKQLPIHCYQIQVKFRDERRPRFGVMRGREFIMKDGYSFHDTSDSLAEEFDKMYETYCRILDRLGLNYCAVQADNGSIGGTGSIEFHILANTGEDAIAISDQGDYAANLEKAVAFNPNQDRAEPQKKQQLVATPNVHTIEELTQFLNIPVQQTVKTLYVKANEKLLNAPFVALVVRGDHTLNEIKASKLIEVADPLTFVNSDELLKTYSLDFGSLGPVDSPVPCIVDECVASMSDFVCGANRSGYHYMGVNWERDASYIKALDLRNVVEGDLAPSGKGVLSIKRGIEVGHIFQLGTKYSEAMDATCLNSKGKRIPLQMGCYGFGVSRVVAAAIEQNYDEKGIVWPIEMTPFLLGIIPIGYEKSEKIRHLTDQLYNQLITKGLDILLDDRPKISVGVKFAEMELIGLPKIVVLSEKLMKKENYVEYVDRKTGVKDIILLSKLIDTLVM